jgi:hypothetical protein
LKQDEARSRKLIKLRRRMRCDVGGKEAGADA